MAFRPRLFNAPGRDRTGGDPFRAPAGLFQQRIALAAGPPDPAEAGHAVVPDGIFPLAGPETGDGEDGLALPRGDTHLGVTEIVKTYIPEAVRPDRGARLLPTRRRDYPPARPLRFVLPVDVGDGASGAMRQDPVPQVAAVHIEGFRLPDPFAITEYDRGDRLEEGFVGPARHSFPPADRGQLLVGEGDSGHALAPGCNCSRGTDTCPTGPAAT